MFKAMTTTYLRFHNRDRSLPAFYLRQQIILYYNKN